MYKAVDAGVDIGVGPTKDAKAAVVAESSAMVLRRGSHLAEVDGRRAPKFSNPLEGSELQH